MKQERRKVFMDTEFTSLTQNANLISIGLISGKDQFYAEFTDYDMYDVNDWVLENVVNKTQIYKAGNTIYNVQESCNIFTDGQYGMFVIGNSTYIVNKLSEWLNNIISKEEEQIEIWSDCLAYDWVLFCQLYKGALNIPKCVYYIPFDLSTLLDTYGFDADINREEFAFKQKEDIPKDTDKHNALWDAMIIEKCYWGISERLQDKLLTVR